MYPEFHGAMPDFRNIKDKINQSKLKLIIMNACLNGMVHLREDICAQQLNLKRENKILYNLEEKSQVQIKKIESNESDIEKLCNRKLSFGPLFERIYRERDEIRDEIHGKESDSLDTDTETESETDSEQEEMFRIWKEQDEALGIPPQQETDSSAQMEIDYADEEYSNDSDNKYGWKAFCIERERLMEELMKEQIALNTFYENKEMETSMKITNETKNTSCNSDGYGSIDLKDISSSLDDNVSSAEENISRANKLDYELHRKKSWDIKNKYKRIINKKLIEFCKMHLEDDIEKHLLHGLSYYDNNNFI